MTAPQHRWVVRRPSSHSMRYVVATSVAQTVLIIGGLALVLSVGGFDRAEVVLIVVAAVVYCGGRIAFYRPAGAPSCDDCAGSRWLGKRR